MENTLKNGISILEDESYNDTWARDYGFWSGGIVKNFSDYCTGGTILSYSLDWDLKGNKIYKMVWIEKRLKRNLTTEKLEDETIYHVQHFVKEGGHSKPTQISHLKFEDEVSALSHYKTISLLSSHS